MNRLDTKTRRQVVACLVEGNGIRATCRMTGVAKGTVLKLIANLGAVCRAFMDETLRDLPCRRIECDEIWSFCYAKDKNLPDSMRDLPGVGSIWTWTAIDPVTKIVPSFFIGDRGAESAKIFMQDLASRLRGRVQLTTDGHRVYVEAVDGAFGCSIDYAMLIKIYGTEPGTEARYSPPEVIETKVIKVSGKPESRFVSTSMVERQNLTMRMGMRRFTRLTNAFSKKVANLGHSVAIHFMHYNFCRVHQTLRVTPAIEAGVADHVWTLDEMIDLLDSTEETARDVSARRRDRRPAVARSN